MDTSSTRTEIQQQPVATPNVVAAKRTIDLREAEFTDWPLRDDRPLAWFVVALVVLLPLLVSISTGVWYWGALALVCLGVTLRRYFLPTGYRWDTRGIAIRSWWKNQLIPWHAVRSMHVRGRGLVAEVWVRRFRGYGLWQIYLPWGPCREQVMNMLQRIPAGGKEAKPNKAAASLASTISQDRPMQG